MPNGPQSFTHTQRMNRAREILARFQAHYGETLIAAGLYGSTARAVDGPYSDIEMHVVLEGHEIDRCFEWSEGPWKAEVDVYSPDVILAQAAEMDEFWPLTHGAFAYVLPFHDPQDIFAHVRQVVMAHTDQEYNTLMREVIIGDIYECVGKLRNALELDQPHIVPGCAVDTARYGACLMGLYHRRLYSGSSAFFPESLLLPDSPAGYAELCGLVMRGELSDPASVLAAADAYWDGLEVWAAQHQIALHTDLDAVLKSRAE